ncbi:MAG: TetR family transcriptional regulator [Anaerolineaceae bacterium]|nr:TetR family transcriptional regulator [Anaerolineaceae bacterium]
MTDNENRRGARRQQRGLQRQAAILEAAGMVFAEAGYVGTTTNAIADRAGISPGSLYQFFPNKEAIADALAKQYTHELQQFWDSTFSADNIHMSLDVLINILVDSMITFDENKPGFSVLFFGDDTSADLAAMGHQLHEGIIGRFADLISARNPNIPPEKCELMANVIIRLYKAFVPVMVEHHSQQNTQMIGEMKAVLRGYLAPHIG